MPSVSIGLPVFNGERFLRRSLETLLRQGFGDFELIVCDNASTDGTEAIVREFAARDDRIRYHRSERNLGAAPNFNRAFDLARAPLFKWAAHDDLHAPGFLGACVRALEDHPDAVLAYPLAEEIDDDEAVLRPYRTPFAATGRPEPHRRFRLLIGDEHNCFPVFGVIRREVLARTARIGSYVGSDRVLLAQLGLFGRFVEVPEVLFQHREHRQRSTRAIPLHQRTAWFDARQGHKRVMPYWRFAREYTLATLRAPLSPAQRLRCQVEVLRWIKRYRRRLVHDVRVRLTPPPTGSAT
jgi:glycosyltransferase involved in cell wall biosynthesis